MTCGIAIGKVGQFGRPQPKSERFTMAISRKPKLKAVEPTDTPEAAPAPTFTPEALAALLNEVSALRAQVASATEAAAPARMSVAGKSEQSIKNEMLVIQAFKRAGYGNVVPHKDVMTFNRWVSQGFRPIVGTKSLKINNLRLFHKTQVRALTPEERGEMKAQSADAVARNEKPKGNGKAASVHHLNPQQLPL